MRLINGDALYRKVKRECNPYGKPTIDFESGNRVLDLIDSQPTIQSEIVRCEECLYRKICSWEKQGAKFCSFAERREVTT